MEKTKEDGNYPVVGETLENLKNGLIENGGENVTPWQFNMLISFLLDFVPEHIKYE